MGAEKQNQGVDQESLSTITPIINKSDQIRHLADTLAARYGEAASIRAARSRSNRDLKPVFPDRNPVDRELTQYQDWLAEAYRYFTNVSQQNVPLTYASEWVLDNYYVIRQALSQIEEDLPDSFYEQLPRLSGHPLKGYPRIYAVARAVLVEQNLLLEPVDLQQIMTAFQEQVPLTMGELWALPIFLRYTLIEYLAFDLVSVIQPAEPPDLPQFERQIDEEISPSLQTASRTAPAADNIANIILSLRIVSEQAWKDFFENVSRLEQTLRQDPAGIYAWMDFNSRDLYRKEIEKLSKRTGRHEIDLAEALLAVSGASTNDNLDQGVQSSLHPQSGRDLSSESTGSYSQTVYRGNHIGEFLLGEKRPIFEKEIGYIPDWKEALSRWAFRRAEPLYLMSIFVLSFVLFLLLYFLVRPSGVLEPGFSSMTNLLFQSHPIVKTTITVLLGLALVTPILTVTTSLVNWIVTLIVPPRILPKFEFKSEIPEVFSTMVVVPAILNSQPEIDSLTKQLELHYLRNPENGLQFGLLTDFTDADQAVLPQDEALVQYALAAMRELNLKYHPVHASSEGDSGGEAFVTHKTGPFYLLHRKRLWNPSERKWIGWERKRGKLHEFNRLLRSDDVSTKHSPSEGELSFDVVSDGLHTTEQCIAKLQSTRYVITLDADSVLPRGSGSRLVGALAHPLNRAVFDEKTGRMKSGYSILQPRMEIHPRSVNHSWFTRFFAGDAGLDLYTLAVSDAYNDLFGEGIFVGKGIYDVDAFMRSVNNYIPENTVLSHDLLEGVMGRVGLVTDITMVEDYPQNYFAQAVRLQRWIRGDWQLLPWLVRPSRSGPDLSAIDRWKMFDNLRRSILAPSLMWILIAGLLFLPSLALLWIMLPLISLGIPMFTSLTRSTLQMLGGESAANSMRPLRWSAMRWILAVAFLPYEALDALAAIILTLVRMLITRRHLLQWTTAAQSAQLFTLTNHHNVMWLRMSLVSITAFVLTVAIQLLARYDVGARTAQWYSIPILVLWYIAPFIAWWINQPIDNRAAPLNQEQVNLLRRIARRTWGFFERYVGPEDHWLPPDHFQESPLGLAAHRTSPTNMGLLLTSTLAAHDFGYLDQLGMVTRLSTTMDTFFQMERFRGHFLNWYDTLTLQPLNPRYISTVDSGNLAASLIITAQACQTMPDEIIFRWNLWQGYLDSLSILEETLVGMCTPEIESEVDELIRMIVELQDEVRDIENHRDRWYPLFLHISGPFWKDLSDRLVKLVNDHPTSLNLAMLGSLQEASAQTERHHHAVQRTISDLVPWIPLFEEYPPILDRPPYAKTFSALRTCLPNNMAYRQIPDFVKGAAQLVTTMHILLHKNTGSGESAEGAEDGALEARRWLDELTHVLERAEKNACTLVEKYNQIVAQAEQLVQEMDFTFLFHPQRCVFHIGFNMVTGQLDQNYYDLLASEARISSLIAIAKKDVPQSHWLHLNRPVTRVQNSLVLLSWSGTMFEYLMPSLYLRSFTGTFLSDTTYGAVRQQISYGKSKGVPWGISESGFYRLGSNQTYQYRAFGVPGLGFKRGLADDLVIAPYASMLALEYQPLAVVQNLENLIKHGMVGTYGLYEAVDFTPDRLPLDQQYAAVREYMAHHQGMILMALDNFFHDQIMVNRMHSDPRIQGVDLLLQEQVPATVPLQDVHAEDVRGVQRITADSEEIFPWRVPVQTSIPQVNLLSNGSYNILITNMGGGYSTWQDTDLTRWQPDGALDQWGNWIYIQELDDILHQPQRFWSVSHQPVPGDAEHMQVTYFAHMAVFRRTENGIISTMEVTVAPNDPVEIRRIHLHNNLDESRLLRITSYGEVILAPQAADARHPAFNKLFIESEFIPEYSLQIFKRRPRSGEEAPLYLGHMLIVEGGQEPSFHEADRLKFIGRGHTVRNPSAMLTPDYLTGTSGATLDPVFSLGNEIKLSSFSSKRLAYVNIAAESREEIINLAGRYREWNLIDHSFNQSNMAAQAWLGKQDIKNEDFQNALQALSSLVFSGKIARAAPEIISTNRLGQPGLWRFGISGDYPILLVEVDQPKQVELAREVLEVYKFLRSRQYKADVVFVNNQPTNYGAELNGMLYRLVSKMNGEQWLQQRGGIYIVFGDQMLPEEYTLLKTAARIAFSGENGDLSSQMPGYAVPVYHLPPLTPTRTAVDVVTAANAPYSHPLPEPEGLQFWNGYGGFSADGKEYVIYLPGSPMETQTAETPKIRATPAPWINVIGYPGFGFMVSESGSQCTWALNSGENRLTPWFNDSVSDPSGEVLYLRDEETGEVWTPTPLPAGADLPFKITHGSGYTLFEHSSHGLYHHLCLFASPEDPVKMIRLKVENTLDHPRRITATQYVEWVLGTTRTTNAAFIIPEYDAAEQCLMAVNPYNPEFAERVAFLIASKPVHGLTADRTEFLGRGGSYAFPASLRRLGLETHISAGEDPCAAMQVHLDLPPGGSEEIYFVLGQGLDREHTMALAKKYHQPGSLDAVFGRTQAFWNRLLDTVQVRTPEPAADLILNRWMLYQALSCRIWGRAALYQSSGAFGFRDQLQDVLALLTVDPAISRSQILIAARHQFAEGDVLHWWHPPSGRGVRTRFSDDLLWLPYVTAQYVETTGDYAILDELIPFRSAPPLAEEEEERYSEFPLTQRSFPLFEHCIRAIEKGSTIGSHGLPLMGTGDWNDGMNLVGAEGRGESVWLGWFLIDVLKRFERLCHQRGEEKLAQTYEIKAANYAEAIEQAAWDGSWYRRAYYDDGVPLGTITDIECQIDAIAQSWSVISGAGDPQRSRLALDAVLKRLVHPQERLSLLFAPPFDKTQHNPGYIKGYLPGIRENGGQYTHAAIWTAWAFAGLRDGWQAGELFRLLNPIFLTDTTEKTNEYFREPYVIAADVYSQPPFVRRGGWTWYTGSAAWMYRLGLETILGFKKFGDSLQIDPVIPQDWTHYEITYRHGETTYHISVENPEQVSAGVRAVYLDETLLEDGRIPLADDRLDHHILVRLGAEKDGSTQG